MTKTEVVLAAYQEVAPSVFAANYAEDCCIAATRVLVAVMRYMGVPCKPLSVKACLMNEQFAENVVRHGWPDRATVEAWGEQDGSHSIGLGMGDPEPGKWAGHLVGLVGYRYLVDGALRQVNRPEKGIIVPEMLIHNVLTPRWVTGGMDQREWIELEQGIMFYAVVPTDRSYVDTPDWKNKRNTDDEIQAILARMFSQKGGTYGTETT